MLCAYGDHFCLATFEMKDRLKHRTSWFATPSGSGPTVMRATASPRQS